MGKKTSKDQDFLLKMQTSEDKTTLMAWISTEDQRPLTQDQALTGVANLFIEICAMMNADPYDVMNRFFEEAPDSKASDFNDN